MTFSHQKNTLTMTLVHHKMYLVVQLPHMKKYFRWKISSAYDGFLRSKMSVSYGLVDNIVLLTRLLPMEVDGLLLLALVIYDGFLCCCDELQSSLIAIFFVVRSYPRIQHQMKEKLSQALYLSYFRVQPLGKGNPFMQE